VIGRSARRQGIDTLKRIDTLKTQFAKVEFIHEDIDHSHRIILGNIGLPGQSPIGPVRGHELGTVDIAGQLTQLADYCDDHLAADTMSLSIAP
jgi:hypothetical protein